MNLNQVSKILMLMSISFCIIVQAKNEVLVMFVPFDGLASQNLKRTYEKDPDSDLPQAKRRMLTYGSHSALKDVVKRVVIDSPFFSIDQTETKNPELTSLDLVFLSEMPKGAESLPTQIGGTSPNILHKKVEWVTGTTTKVDMRNYMALYAQASTTIATHEISSDSFLTPSKKQFMLAGKKQGTGKHTCIVGVHLHANYVGKDPKTFLPQEIERIMKIEQVKTCNYFLVLGDFNMDPGFKGIDQVFNVPNYQNQNYKCQGHGVPKSNSASTQAFMGAIYCVPQSNTIKKFKLYKVNRFYTETEGSTEYARYWTDHHPIYVEAEGD